MSNPAQLCRRNARLHASDQQPASRFSAGPVYFFGGFLHALTGRDVVEPSFPTLTPARTAGKSALKPLLTQFLPVPTTPRLWSWAAARSGLVAVRFGIRFGEKQS